MIHLRSRGIAFVISAPSSCGKSSITKRLIDQDHSIKRSVSVTTRTPRVDEIEGVDYYFKTHDEFQEILNRGDMLEYVNMYGNYYGTLKSTVHNVVSAGADIILNLDANGMGAVREFLPEDTVSIFLVPPSLTALQSRIENRGQNTSSDTQTRMESAKHEVLTASQYDYVVINDDFDLALNQISSIFSAERLKSPRLKGLEQFLKYAE